VRLNVYRLLENHRQKISIRMCQKNGVIGYYTYYPSKGEIYLEDKTCGIINVSYHDGTSELVNFIPERGFYNELLNYYNAINGTEQISVTPEMEYGDVKMVFDILDSVSFREIIYVDEEEPKRRLEIADDEAKIHPFLQ